MSRLVGSPRLWALRKRDEMGSKGSIDEPAPAPMTLRVGDALLASARASL